MLNVLETPGPSFTGAKTGVLVVGSRQQVAKVRITAYSGSREGGDYTVYQNA